VTEQGRVMKLFKIAALFLLSLSISARAAFAGDQPMRCALGLNGGLR
jgi:hypothetical protein